MDDNIRDLIFAAVAAWRMIRMLTVAPDDEMLFDAYVIALCLFGILAPGSNQTWADVLVRR